MKVTCSHCSQRISIDAETLASLAGHSEFECPACSQAVPVPAAEESLDGLAAEHLLLRGLQTPQPAGAEWEPPTPEELDAAFDGRYRITRLLGRGGMGAVYCGVDTRLNRAVAIKVLPIEHGDRPEALARFEREARAMAALDHPHIVKVHDFGSTAEGHIYFVMELIHGADIRGLRQSGQLTLASALEFISQVCSALHYAHRAGFVHRDIKPANILVTHDGRAKVADFGLARAIGAESRTPSDPTLTASGAIMGTPEYMAPEQRVSGRVDQRADLYPIGVMLYEFLTGTPPRGAWSPPSDKVAIDLRLDEIVHRALQENPAARYQTASELKLDIDLVKATTGGEPLPPGIEPEPLPSSRAGGAVARPRRTPAVAQQAIAVPAFSDPSSAELVLKTTSSLNNTMLVLGSVALLTVGALAFFLANRKTGDTYNSEQTVSSEETHNNYLTQLIATGVATERQLEAVTDIRPYGARLVGITRQEYPWPEALALAQQTGATILSIEDDATTRAPFLDWLKVTFAPHLSTPVWVREQGELRTFDGRDLLPSTTPGDARKAILQWTQAQAPPTPARAIQPTEKSATKTTPPQPALQPSTPTPAPAKPSEPIAWTMKDGRVIKAEFVSLSGDAVIVLMDGRQYSIAYPNLSPASVERAKSLAVRRR